MAKSSPLLDYLVDQLAPLGEARGRAMFGGFGVYLDGLIIGIIAFDTFYLKVDDTNRGLFEAADSQPFSYQQGKHKATMNAYWECPADVLEEPDRLRDWAAGSLAVSRRAQAPNKKRGKQAAPGKAGSRKPAAKSVRQRKR